MEAGIAGVAEQIPKRRHCRPGPTSGHWLDRRPV